MTILDSNISNAVLSFFKIIIIFLKKPPKKFGGFIFYCYLCSVDNKQLNNNRYEKEKDYL
jgi:hypothetical protein